jgi:hypothetical protein
MASISDHGSLRIIPRSDSSSPRGHISPLHEASTLLSPVQLHRDSPVQERDRSAIVEHVEDENETQPSLSPFPAPSNPSSTREGKDARSISFRRATHWKTLGMIIGFLFAGQSACGRGRMPLTLRSPSFCHRTLSACQKLGRQPHQYQLSHAIPSLCRLYPLDNHLQSRADRKYRNMLCATPMVRSSWERNAAGHDREAVRVSHKHTGTGRPAQHLEGAFAVPYGSLGLVPGTCNYLSSWCADRHVRGA